MDKFIIELPDSTAWLQWVKVAEDGTVCFDYKYPEDLTPCTEPDLDAIRNEAYEKGVQDTKQHWVDAPRSCAYKLGYENGLNDAWETARKIASDNAGQNYSIFGQHFTVEILNTHSASECIEKIRQYEQEQENKQEENKESCQNCKFAKNPKVQEPCVRCSHSFYNFFRVKVKESES